MEPIATTPCGLDHVGVFRHNTGKLPGGIKLRKMQQSCDEWNRRLQRDLSSTPATTVFESFERHAAIAQAWNAHLQDLGSGES